MNASAADGEERAMSAVVMKGEIGMALVKMVAFPFISLIVWTYSVVVTFLRVSQEGTSISLMMMIPLVLNFNGINLVPNRPTVSMFLLTMVPQLVET